MHFLACRGRHEVCLVFSPCYPRQVVCLRKAVCEGGHVTRGEQLIHCVRVWTGHTPCTEVYRALGGQLQHLPLTVAIQPINIFID
jgi:hypothetical protein